MKRTFLLAAVLGCALLGSTARAQSEDTVKAAFLFNFAKFTEWPADAFASPAAPVTVGFVGGGGLPQIFEQNVKGKNANGRDFLVRSVTASTLDGCHVVYVSDPQQAGAVLAALRGKSVLVVGETDGLLEQGGAIAFAREGAKILFDLHAGHAAAARLKLDPKLAKIARNVRGG